MDVQTWFTRIVICLVLGFISKAPCLCQQQYDDRSMLYDDDYYDDTETVSGGPDSLTVADTTYDPPYFERTEITISASPNNDVLMNCDVRNYHANNVVIWYKDKTAIVNGQYSMDSRYESLKNNSILLRNAQPEDGGNYYCAVLPQNITLNVRLVVEKSLTIRCDGRDVLDRTIVYRQGESHICECKTPGITTNNIKWYLNNRRAADSKLEVDQDSIVMNDIGREHGGTYQCLDDDGSAIPRHGMFEVVVHYAPEMTSLRHYVNTEIGGSAELYCDYSGNPIAITRWLKNNEELSYSDKHMMTYSAEKDFNRTTLTIRDVTIDDLGEYKCVAENSIGWNELRVHLILEPENGQFEDIMVEGNLVTLQWLVRSLQPLSEAVLDYKMIGAYTWSSTTVLHTQRHEGGIWKITHKMELLPGEWQTRMKTKNTMGWSKFSEAYEFIISEDEDSNIIVDTREKVVIAGFGGGDSEAKRGAAAAFTTNYLPPCLVLLIPIAAFFRDRLHMN